MMGEDTLKAQELSDDTSLWSTFTGGLKSAFQWAGNGLSSIFAQNSAPSNEELHVISLNNGVELAFLNTGQPFVSDEDFTVIPNDSDHVIITAALDTPEIDMVQTYDGEHKILRMHEGQIPFEEETKTMQMQLLEGGYELPRFGVDGLFGKETDAAVRELQREAGLEVDGEFGVDEQIALNNKIQLMNNPVIEHAARTNETSREFASARDYDVSVSQQQVLNTLSAAPLANYSRISDPFGIREVHPVTGEKNVPHKGIDYAAPQGTPVYAAADGHIRGISTTGADGNFVGIKHGAGVETGYSHLHSFAEGIKSNMDVTKGQLIGYVGTTGQSSGNHLHYGVKVDGEFIDPQSLPDAQTPAMLASGPAGPNPMS